MEEGKFNKILCIILNIIFLLVAGYLYVIGYDAIILVILLGFLLGFLLRLEPKKFGPQKNGTIK